MSLSKISVIVPIYNVEAYLPACIESILAQTYDNLEIILVNDGSPDNCPAICDDYAKKDARIVVIHKENGGVADARNAGLDIATGEYIGFVDPDDYIHKDMYYVLYNLLKDNNANIAHCAFSRNIIEDFEITEEISVMESGAFFEYIVGSQAVMVWSYLYHADLWKGLRFEKGYYDEDVLAILHLCARKPRVVKTTQILYGYRFRNDSFMRLNKNKKHIRSFEFLMETTETLIATHPEFCKTGTLEICKNIPSFFRIISPNENITAFEANAHNQKMYALFCKYFPDAKTSELYKKESLTKRMYWNFYRYFPNLSRHAITAVKKILAEK